MAAPREPDFSEAALTVLQARYLRRSHDGAVAETPGEMLARVARAIADAELRFGGVRDARAWEERFFDAMASLEFLPSSPVLMNAGTDPGQLSACFVLPIEDSIESIFGTLALAARIHKTGGGTGFDFSSIRPRGAMASGASGGASGPLSFLRVFDAATREMREGGRRRGANMGVLAADHADVCAFVDAKREEDALRSFNLSIGASDAFFEAVERDAPWTLRDPRDRRATETLSARALFDRIVDAAWACGDPGFLFLDAIARGNPTPSLGRIVASNPCGEVPLLPYECCILGSIHLARCVRGDDVDWEKLRALTRLAVRFLDDVIEVNRLPTRELSRAARRTRKIGVGVMGLAEALVHLGLPYDAPSATTKAEDVARFLREVAEQESKSLAAERGPFPTWHDSALAVERPPRRNATLLSIAPTGTLALLAGTSTGIEPLYGLAITRRHALGESGADVSPLLLSVARRRGVDLREATSMVLRTGSLQTAPKVPDDLRRLFRCAVEIAPDAHLAMQAAFQRHVDNAVSKTINLPRGATCDTIARIFRDAHARGLKGITIYRDGSRARQVLSLGAQPARSSCDVCTGNLEDASDAELLQSS